MLDPEVEARLGNEILEALEEDIAKELEIELEVSEFYLSQRNLHLKQVEVENGDTIDENNLTYSSDGAGILTYSLTNSLLIFFN